VGKGEEKMMTKNSLKNTLSKINVGQYIKQQEEGLTTTLVYKATGGGVDN